MALGAVGFIGLGNMGEPMARRLLDCGNALVAFDIQADPLKRLAELGATTAASPGDVARGCAVVFMSLPEPQVVRRVGAELIEHGAAGLIIVDFSTNDPDTASYLHMEAQKRSIDYVDAPVSGGPSRAASGELTLMVGGAAGAVERVRPLLQNLGPQVQHVGPAGSGGVAKLLNNFVAIWGMVGVSQALVAASVLGISLDNLYEVMAKSSGRSYSLDRNFPKIRDEDYSPNFSLKLAAKDMRLALELMNSAGLSTFAGADLERLFNYAIERGDQDKDVAVLHNALSALVRQ
jgi:3-hydroxyisobutyrate dehydrogenase-like beta-hydroxyacid dehydrogenase